MIDKVLEFKTALDSERLNGRGDHIIAKCPYCNKEGHLYFNFIKALKKNKKGHYQNCWDCKKCSESGNVFKLLKHIGRLDILPSKENLGIKNVLSPNLLEEFVDLHY